MMKLFHKMLLRMLPGPFCAWLLTLLFLLLMQFLIKYLPDLAGRGLPIWLVMELISYNVAYMVVLAVPMSMLLSTLMAFSRLAESRAYLVMKNSGVSFLRLLWPVLVAGGGLAIGMAYFNNVVLPESNFRARNLWQDVRNKRPDFELQSGIFYEGLNNYSILVRERAAGTQILHDILIHDYTRGRSGATIKARTGWLEPAGNAVDLILEQGEVHRLIRLATVGTKERYERLAFDRYRLRLDLSEFAFERSNPKEGYRSDRTTRTSDMVHFVDSLDASISEHRAQLRTLALQLTRNGDASSPFEAAELDSASPPIARVALAGLTRTEGRRLYAHALEGARNTHAQIENIRRNITREASWGNRYRVEIHKKYSIALACLIFVLIGAPLGLTVRRGGAGGAVGLALVIFLFYWVTLVQGEKLADRDFISPWIGMWFANICIVAVGIWLVLYLALDLHATPPILKRLRQRFHGNKER